MYALPYIILALACFSCQAIESDKKEIEKLITDVVDEEIDNVAGKK